MVVKTITLWLYHFPIFSKLSKVKEYMQNNFLNMCLEVLDSPNHNQYEK